MQKALATGITREDVADGLFRLGVLQLQAETVEAEMQTAIDTIKSEFSPALERLLSRIDDEARQLRLACEDSRQDLLTGKAKQIKTLFGRVGWRSQPVRIALQKGVGVDQAVGRLLSMRCADLVRTRQEPDKPAIKAALTAGQLGVDDLDAAGIRVRPGGEDWWYEIDRDHVVEHRDRSA